MRPVVRGPSEIVADPSCHPLSITDAKALKLRKYDRHSGLLSLPHIGKLSKSQTTQ